MATKERPNGYWTDIRLQEEAIKYPDKRSFKKGNGSAFIIAHRRGKEFFSRICSHMPECIILHKEEKPNFKWTLEKLIVEARKHQTREDFKRANLGAHSVAVKRKDYNSVICAHMPPPKNEAYSDEELKEITSKFEYIGDFAKEFPGAYGVIKNKKRLKEFCSHMKRRSGSSGPEKEILAETRKFFPNAKKIRHTKLSILNRPYIHAFEIDVFVPELGLGIEFDGRRHHSFEHMRKDKSKQRWPDEAVVNYHPIKDEYFASKGITILHIKEQNWMDNKEQCISQIEQFLGITGFMSKTETKAA